MYHPITRVLTVLELLQAHPSLSGTELARRLEVNARTVRHYITLLQDIGIPIETERGRYGGYRLQRGFKLPPLMFSEEEALALVMGLLMARRVGLAAATPAVEGALAKVERVMPESLRASVAAVQQTLVISGTSWYCAPGSAAVFTFSVAAQQRQRVQMRYRAWDDAETERAIEPYGVVFYDGRWFVVGRCLLRQALRLFRLDRVVHAALAGGTFARPDEFDCLAYVVQSLVSAPGVWAVDVLLETTLDIAHERVPPAMAALEAHPAGVRFVCHAQNLDWIARLLVSLGVPFVVQQPPELCAALAQLHAEIGTALERSAAREQHVPLG